MNAKEFLMQYRDCVDELRSKRVEREQLLDDARAVGEPDTTDLEAEIESERKKFYETRRKVRAAINAVPVPKLRQLLRYKYICGFEWEIVSEKMSRSYMHVVHRLQKEALNFVDDFLKRETQ